jgi:chromate transport protein ChrA
MLFDYEIIKYYENFCKTNSLNISNPPTQKQIDEETSRLNKEKNKFPNFIGSYIKLLPKIFILFFVLNSFIFSFAIEYNNSLFQSLLLGIAYSFISLLLISLIQNLSSNIIFNNILILLFLSIFIYISHTAKQNEELIITSSILINIFIIFNFLVFNLSEIIQHYHFKIKKLESKEDLFKKINSSVYIIKKISELSKKIPEVNKYRLSVINLNRKFYNIDYEIIKEYKDNLSEINSQKTKQLEIEKTEKELYSLTSSSS